MVLPARIIGVTIMGVRIHARMTIMVRDVNHPKIINAVKRRQKIVVKTVKMIIHEWSETNFLFNS